MKSEKVGETKRFELLVINISYVVFDRKDSILLTCHSTKGGQKTIVDWFFSYHLDLGD